MGNYLKKIKSFFGSKFENETSSNIDNNLNYLIKGQFTDINRILKPEESIKITIKSSSLGNIASTVLTPAKMIKPFIRNIDTNKYTDKHPLLELLKEPNDEQEYTDFIYEACFQKLFTNNIFLEKIGTNNVFEVYPVNPAFISVWGTAKDLNYSVSASEYYKFLNSNFKGKNGIFKSTTSYFKTLYHFKGMSDGEGYYGLSPLNSILRELELSNAINDYNISLLGNGANLSGVFTLDSNNPDDLKRLKQDTENNFGGTRNAGKFLVTLGKSVDFKPFGATNKEMAFGEFLDKSEQKIYMSFDIPLPLITQDTQTYNNYETANYILHICVVLPLLKDVFEYLSTLYRDIGILGENEELCYNPEDIQILKLEALESIKTLEGVAEINELRKKVGLIEKPMYNKLLVGRNQIDIKDLNKLNQSSNNSQNDSQDTILPKKVENK